MTTVIRRTCLLTLFVLFELGDSSSVGRISSPINAPKDFKKSTRIKETAREFILQKSRLEERKQLQKISSSSVRRRVRRSEDDKKEIFVKIKGRRILLLCRHGSSSESTKRINVDVSGSMDKYTCVCYNCENSTISRISPFVPSLSSPRSNYVGRIGEDATLVCDAHAEPMPVFKWYKLPLNFDPDDDADHQNSERISQSRKHSFLLDFIPRGFQSTLKIRNVSEEDLGFYMCLAKNYAGTGVLIENLIRENSPASSVSMPLGSFVITFFAAGIVTLFHY